ncbi:MAG: nucleoside 2-deoxyribosyltransferase [Deltaproteobacteria bacterium]|jgi:nucleoside 2-deoxyribosyltransferase|nr:nucleoside 2-deoxyribosyltransferase [Deltaproteobacteria bacterium]
MTKVYLAGPDVFMPGYPDKVARMRELCASLNLEPLAPGDDELDNAEEIVAHNLSLIAQADLVVANLSAFRGLEPDSGTVFECGYAKALGKAVIGYLDDPRDMLSKAREAPGGPAAGSSLFADGSFCENFGFPLNIMIAVTAKKLCRNLEEALRAAAENS